MEMADHQIENILKRSGHELEEIKTHQIHAYSAQKGTQET